MNENTQTEFKTEGQPAFPAANTENDNSADSSSEETNTDSTQSQEGEENSSENNSTPNSDNTDNTDKDTKEENLADNPRWKEREGDWKDRFNDQETRHTKAIEDLRKEFEGKSTQSDTENTSEIPSWFGGDANDWSQYQKDQQTALDKVKNDTLNELTTKKADDQKAIDEATNFLNTEVTSIEADKTINPDGLKVDRNKLFKFVFDQKLVDTDGRWNYRAGWQLMQAGVKAVKNDKIQEKKNIAGATTSEGGSEVDKSNVTTSEDFQNPANRPW